jgi:GNAT superfamily N-acetyltransferase
MSFDRLFRSDRLFYKALSNSPEEKAFMRVVVMDPTTYAQTTSRLLAPPRSEDIDKDMAGLSNNALLAVMICLPAGSDIAVPAVPSEQLPVAGDQSSREQPTSAYAPVGWLTLDSHPVTRHHRTCNLGIMLATAHQGKGYGAEAINWALGWAFDVAGMHAVRLSCFSFNERAVKLYQRLGFVKEGVRRESYYYGSQWHDHVLFSMLEDEWRSLKTDTTVGT